MMKVKRIYTSSLPRKKLYLIFILCVILVTDIKSEEVFQYPPQQIIEHPSAGSPRPEGAIKRLTCQATAIPTPLYSWLKDGVFLRQNMTQTVYEIENLKRSDAGEYRCLASNILGGMLTRPAIIVVAYMEPFEQGGPIDVSVDEGRSLIIHLPTIVSIPAPVVDWIEKKPNNSTTTLRPEDQYHSISLLNHLVILEANVANSRHEYHARAVNVNVYSNNRMISRSYRLNVADLDDSTSFLQPTVVVAPVPTLADVGDHKVELECIINARPITRLVMNWYRVSASGSDERIDPGEHYLFSTFRRKLTIKKPALSDSGMYKCEGFLNQGSSARAVANATLTVRGSPKITPQLPGIIEKAFSETVEITCTAIGIPAPTIRWYYNGHLVSSLQRSRTVEFANGTLRIDRVEMSDMGLYQCIAQNRAGEDSSVSWLKVNSSPPKFTSTPDNLTIVETRDAKFYCQATGAPTPVVSWYKVVSGIDSPIVSDGRYQILNDGLLIVSTKKQDSALYKCVASNVRGQILVEALLQVIVKTQIVRPPQNSTEILSTRATLECGVSHDENIQPQWDWFFYKKPSYSEEHIVSGGRRIITATGSLIISGVAGQDIGRYKCVVTSAGGNDSRVATLLVIELPRKPVITSVTLARDTDNSVIITWTPGFNGNSPLQRYIISYRVEVQGANNDNSRWQVYPDIIKPNLSQYTVSNLQPSRFYKFKISAFNSVGEGNASIPKPDPAIQMPPQPPGRPPRNFYCSPGPDRSILVKWQAPEENSWNGDLLGFIIQYRVANYPDLALQKRNITDRLATSYVLDNLVYHKQYEVAIAAYNIKGPGVYSSYFFVWTLEGRPTAPPQNITLVSTNSTTIKVTWLPPDPTQINGINQGYTISLRRSVVSQTERSEFFPSDQDNLYGHQTTHIYNLMKYTEYVITVVCQTSRGQGPASNPQMIRTQEDVPGKVGDLKFDNVRDRTLRVLWTAPQEINGELQGYTVIWERKNESHTRQQVELPSNLTSYTIRKLSPITKYTIYVHARTRKGPGLPKSADIESGVPPELPTEPFNLAYSNIEARSVLLQFLPGSNGKTSITLWIVEALEGSSTRWKHIYNISSPNARAINVLNLKPYTKYRLRIIAENIVGRSNSSAPTREFETKQDAPSKPPGNVTVRALNSTALRISWTPLSLVDWNGIPRGYNIYYRMKMPQVSLPDSSFTIVQLENGMDIESYFLVSLQEWVAYEVKMNSYNDVGTSQFSPITGERTRESVPSASPTRVHAVANSSTSINVTWQPVPPLEQNGMILGYKVQYSSYEENIPARQQDVFGNGTMSSTVGGLRKFVKYEIQVLAYTRMGDGMLSTPVSVKTFEDYPGPPIIIYFPVVTYSSALVVWSPPKEPNGLISAYRVTYKKQGSNESSAAADLQADQLNHTVLGLHRETYYEFYVTAKTRLGWGQAAKVLVYTMNDRDRPASPSKPTIGSSQVTARSVTISWNPGNDNYGPLRNYTVQFQRRLGMWISVRETIAPEKTSYVVSNLRPNTWYKFRVAATNDIGTSEYSAPSAEVQTQPDKPDGAPQNLKVKAVTMTSIQVTWEQPPQDSWNGQIVGYLVQYRQLHLAEFQEESVSFDHNSIGLQNLVVKKHYEVQVLAFNVIGQGPTSTPATIYVGEAAPTDAPSRVQAKSESSSSIYLTWVPPPPESQNGGLSGYKILYWPENSSVEYAQTKISPDSHFLLGELDTFTMYHMTVQAYNLAGDGPKSPTVSNRTLEGLPTIPGQLNFSNITLQRVTVSWSPPEKPNGNIIKYELIYFLSQPHGLETKLVKLFLNGSQHSITIDELDEYSNYTYEIRARTRIGFGPARINSSVTGPQPGLAPGQPSKPELEVTQKFVTLTWMNNGEGASNIFGYMIQAKAEDEQKFKTIMQKNSREPMAVISFQNLTPNTRYQFRVIAINSDSISYPSDVSAYQQTPGPAMSPVGKAKPFHTEWWFLVIIALTGVIVILIIISLLCLISRRHRSNKMKRSQTTTTVASDSPEPEEGGFPTYELRQSRRSINMRNGSAKNIYARSPPRPSPASVTYSDDDLAMAKGPIPDDSSSSITEKPSDLGDSTEPSDDESDLESEKGPSSPPPPPFTHYANKDNVRQSWRFPSPHNAYAYTDSEVESSHYAMSLNNGDIVVNNTAGSRTPLTGFSSFV
ncbi:protein sidekick-like isoform X2 [Gigantopelta aegis]|uniref:protein sidekick-like isoform X2 n=1 Tax=Gigantopelta aegis TaxID=1735272 RepID=UPI001B88B0B4|nr:protein sidekick-like isoform X2 [Gigantopelta aegis]